MASWGKTDDANSVPTYLSTEDANNAVFVDLTEAGVESNRAKGLKTPGWNLYQTYTDQNGNTRHKVEPLVTMKVTAEDAGDLGVSGNTAFEDQTVSDS